MKARIEIGDALTVLKGMPAELVQCVVTSPPYWGLRDYGCDGQIGLEATPEEYIEKLVEVFREVRRVLRSDGTCWINMGDSYAGSWGAQSREYAGKHAPNVSALSANEVVAAQRKASHTGSIPRGSGLKPKDLVGIPWMLAFALRADGWWLRQDIIWAKPNPMPESVTDRCTKAHEYLFLLTKCERYFYDAEAIKEPSAASTLPRAMRAQTSEARLSGIPGQSPHSIHQQRTRNGANSFRGQGSNRDSENGPANRGERDMSVIGVGENRNKRSVWTIATEAYAEAHFATFPTKLVEPCFLAGTSEQGCCGVCGAPLLRVTEPFDIGKTQKMTDNWAVGDYAHGTILAEGRRQGETGKPVMASRTMGWKAACTCEAAAIPCTVLDPFSGAGTTGLVALRLGRAYIGIELSPEYAAMSLRRIEEDAPLFRRSVEGAA